MLLQQITVVGHATVEKEYHEAFLAEASQLVALNRQEKGCIQSFVLQHMSDANQFILQEIWANKDAWTAHLQKKHVSDFVEKSNTMGKGFQLHKFQQCDI